MKMLFSLLALLGLAVAAEACPGAARARVTRTHIKIVQSYPLPMPSALPAAKPCQVAAAKVRYVGVAAATAASKTYSVAPVRKALTFAGSLGSCPAGGCK